MYLVVLENRILAAVAETRGGEIRCATAHVRDGPESAAPVPCSVSGISCPGCQGSCRMTLLAAKRIWTQCGGPGGGSPRTSWRFRDLCGRGDASPRARRSQGDVTLAFGGQRLTSNPMFRHEQAPQQRVGVGDTSCSAQSARESSPLLPAVWQEARQDVPVLSGNRLLCHGLGGYPEDSPGPTVS
jgi:hypothetical protein